MFCFLVLMVCALEMFVIELSPTVTCSPAHHVLLLDELSQRNCTDDSLIIVNVIDPPTKLYAHAITFDEENVKYHRLFQAVNSLAPGRA